MLIELENISKTYGTADNRVDALNDIDLTVAEGEFVAITGPSGSGKSTLLYIIGLLERQSSGKYILESRAVNTLNDRNLSGIRNRAIGFIFQTFQLLPRLNVLENVCVPLFYAGITGRTAREKSLVSLKKVGLEKRLTHIPSELSGGEMQRVAIARALVNEPKLLLADEPTGNLDRKTGKTIMSILKSLNDGGLTIILVTHDEDVVKSATRIINLEDGKLVNDL